MVLARADQDAAAKLEYQKLLAVQPDHRKAALNLGALLMREKKWEEAATVFEAAIAAHPKDAALHYNLGLAQAGADHVEAAVKSYEAAIQIQPDYFRALYNLASLEYRQQHYAAARGHLERALVIHADNYKALYNLGLTLLKMDLPVEAEAALRKARAVEETVEVDYDIGLALTRQERFTDAEQAYRSALKIEPKHARSLERLGEALSRQHKHEEAVARFAQLQKLDPADPSAYNAGLELYRSGKMEESLAYFAVGAAAEGAVRRKSLSMQGVALAKLGRPKEAVSVYRTALEGFPGEPSLIRNLARALAQLNDHAAALSELEELRHRKGDDPETLFLIADEEAALGHRDQALAGYRAVLQLDPKHSEARAALAKLEGTAQ